MQIEWTTFALEIVNFLALVWLLKRFLYQPVLDILAQRRAAIERIQAEAHATEAHAQDLQREFERRLADWESEKAAARTQLTAELAHERAQALQRQATALADERLRSAAVEAHQREQQQREYAAEAMAQARRFTEALLAGLGSPAIDASLLERLIAELEALPADELRQLRLAASEEAATAQVLSAFALSAEQQRQLCAALARVLQRQLEVSFGDDRRLLAGLRVSLGAWHLHLNFADELARFAAPPDHAE